MPKTVVIPITNGVAGATNVATGDQVQWTANVLSYVIPPEIFKGSGCKGTFPVSGDGTPAPAKPCHVTATKGTHPYSCGVGASGTTYKERVGSSNDVIIIDPGKPET